MFSSEDVLTNGRARQDWIAPFYQHDLHLGLQDQAWQIQLEKHLAALEYFIESLLLCWFLHLIVDSFFLLGLDFNLLLVFTQLLLLIFKFIQIVPPN